MSTDLTPTVLHHFVDHGEGRAVYMVHMKQEFRFLWYIAVSLERCYLHCSHDTTIGIPTLNHAARCIM
jgi:hypothetical protein